MSQTNPLDRLKTLTDAEASRRIAERERNRREMPGLASLSDEFRAMNPDFRLVHGEENGREIGKRPTLPANVVELDFFKCAEMAAMGQPKGRKG